MLNEEQLFNDDTASSRSSSHSDLSDSESYGRHLTDEPTTFNSLYYSKQVETLKHLRNILNENKLLKKRLNLVESELEQYQDFKSVFPLKDLNAQLEEEDKSESDIDDSLLKTTDDKECQTDPFLEMTVAPPSLSRYQTSKEKPPTEKTILIIEEKTLFIKEEPEPIKPKSAIIRQSSSQFLKTTLIESTPSSAVQSPQPPPMSSKSKTKSTTPSTQSLAQEQEEEEEYLIKSEESIAKTPKVVRFETESQTDNAILYVQQINELKNELETVKRLKEDEINVINMANLELKIELENLKRKAEAITRDYEAISEKFNEFRLNNMDCEHELELLRERNVELQYENDQLNKVVHNKDNQLINKDNEIELLKENNRILKESCKLIDEQQKQIEYLLAENEKHLKEKHVVCQQKITELTNECNSYAEFIKTQNTEMKSQLDLISQQNLDIEKLKIDQQSFNFKEFVNLKRELNCLKQEKERQFASEVITQPNSISNAVVLAQQPLPPIKETKRNLFKFFN